MECLNCGGPLQVGKASYVVNRHGYHLIIDDVPAFICAQCGQPLFTCLLYTSPSPRDRTRSRMPSSA